MAQKGADFTRGLSMMIGSFLSELGIIIMLADVIRAIYPDGGVNETQVVEVSARFPCYQSCQNQWLKYKNQTIQ